MIINTQTLDALNTGFKTNYQSGYTQAKPSAEVLATAVPSSTKDNTYGWMAKIPRMQKWAGDRVVQNLAAHSHSLVNETFELTVGVPREHIEDDNLGIYTPLMSEMGSQSRMLWHDLILAALAAGETSLCFDGQFFFDTDHPIIPKDPSSGTYSNLFTATPLTATNFETRRAGMESLVGEDGKPLGLQVTHVVCGPALRGTANRIFNAQKNDAGADNVNYKAAEVLVFPEISGSEWYLMDLSRAIKPIVVQKRKEPTFTSLTNPTDQNVFMKNEYIWGTDGRGAAGYTLPFLAAKCKP